MRIERVPCPNCGGRGSVWPEWAQDRLAGYLRYEGVKDSTADMMATEALDALEQEVEVV